MAKKRVYKGAYAHSSRKYSSSDPSQRNKMEVQNFSNIAMSYVSMVYSTIASNYFAIATIAVVILISFLLPDIAQKIHKTAELKAMKNVINHVANEVSRAEVACLTAAEELCCLHYTIHDTQTETSGEVRQLSVCTSRRLLATQSEPVQVEKKGFLHRANLNRNDSKKEIALMSIVYTDSFNIPPPITN